MTSFPLTESLGVQVHGSADETYNGFGGTMVSQPFVFVADLERALEQAPVVYGVASDPYNWGPVKSTDTHSARLLCVQPIVRDTHESVLRELVRIADSGGFKTDAYRSDLFDRARRLLGQGA